MTRVLVLGGTVFVGRAIAEAAVARGHQVTVFNRGVTAPGSLPGVEALVGDRDGGLEALRGGRWDIVVDACGYVPRVVEQSARLLDGAVGRYVFISSISVFADFTRVGQTESGELIRLEDPTTEDVGAHYGGLKVLCEEVVDRVYGERGLVVRPGIVAGPHDPTYRFTYWAQRLARGGPMLAPGDGEAPVQFIDARDLADFTLTAAEAGAGGRLNATGPAARLTFGGMLAAGREALGSDAELRWVAAEKLAELGLSPMGSLPLWAPQGGVFTFNCARAIGAGLRFRSLEETFRATVDWWRGAGEPVVEGTGLAPAQEAEILANS